MKQRIKASRLTSHFHPRNHKTNSDLNAAISVCDEQSGEQVRDSDTGHIVTRAASQSPVSTRAIVGGNYGQGLGSLPSTDTLPSFIHHNGHKH